MQLWILDLSQMAVSRLPLSSGTVTAEAVVTGKRKEAIAACALEACRLLDRLGELDPNKDNSNSGKRVRSKAYWEENDYYSSDEDTFIDRTGQVERKRLGRIRQLGVQGPDADEAEKQAAEFTRNSRSLVSKRLDSASLMTVLTKLEEVGEQIVSLEDKLEEIDKAFAPQMANPSELDELEAYMNALKSGAPTQKERMKLKSQLFTLRQAEMRLFQQAGLSQLRRHAAALTQNDESGLDRSSSNGRIHRTDAAAAVRAAKRRLENGPEAGILAATENRPTNTRLKIDEIKRSLQSHSKAQKTNDAPSLDEPFEVEEDDNEDEDAHQNKLSDAPSPSVKINTSRTTDPKQPQSPPVQALIRVHTGTESIVWSSDSTKSAVQKVHIAERPLPLMDQQLDAPGPDSVCSSNHTVREPTEECKPRSKNSECAHNGSTQNEDVVNSKRPRMSRPQLPAEPMDVFHQADPDYVTWIPPPDQQGDGITALNAKFGY
ncbi:Kanadaptin [Paragonimus heterotremus]|uniref:Kanadaptin n=1 Tax=Paragonimus heterotremus TaxID=100268 RepID=A0A8J4WQY7_9TREM|nr:Kanadaptin [Paragonimus heterotremus]